MLGFLKKIFGLPTKEEVEAAKSQVESVPYKVEPVVVNNKTGEVVDVVNAESKLTSVNDQITDSVTQSAEPVKKTRKPRTVKAEKPVKEKVVKEKAAKPVKAAAKKVAVRRLKKV